MPFLCRRSCRLVIWKGHLHRRQSRCSPRSEQSLPILRRRYCSRMPGSQVGVQLPLAVFPAIDEGQGRNDCRLPCHELAPGHQGDSALQRRTSPMRPSFRNWRRLWFYKELLLGVGFKSPQAYSDRVPHLTIIVNSLLYIEQNKWKLEIMPKTRILFVTILYSAWYPNYTSTIRS